MSRIHRGLLLAILLAAFGLRLFRLPDANIWWDEGLAVWAARMPLVDMMRWTASDVHPPLYFALLHVWRMPLGDSEFAVRLLSAMAGTLTVAAVWSLGRVLFPRRPTVGLLAAFMLALARFPIWWSQEARMYMLGGLLFTLGLYFTVRLRRRPTWPVRIGYLLSTIAGLWTLYTLAFALIIQGVYWLGTLRSLAWPERWRRLVAWAGYQVVVLAAFLPWLIYALPRMHAWSVQVPFRAGTYLQLYATLIWVGTSTHVERYGWLIGVLGVVVLLGIVIGWKRWPESRDGWGLLLLALVIPPLVIWFVTTMPHFGYSPKPEARYLLPFTPPIYLLLVAALVVLLTLIRGPWSRFVVVALVVVGLVLGQGLSLKAYYAQRYLTDDYRSLSWTLAAYYQPDDGVFLHTDQPWPVFAYYWPHAFQGWPNGQDADPASVEHWLKPVWEAHQALWLVVNEDALRADPQRLVEAWLAERAVAQHAWRFGPKRLILYARTSTRGQDLLALNPQWTPPPPRQPLAVDGVQVMGWEQPLRRVRRGDYAHVAVTLAGKPKPNTATWTLSLGGQSRELRLPSGRGPIRQVVTFLPRPGGPSGRVPYRLDTGQQRVEMGWVTLLPEAPLSSTNRPPQHPLEATFGDPPLVRLLGYDLTGEARPGGELRLTLHWQVEHPTEVSYKVFVHLIGSDGRPAAQGDAFPMQGKYPTTAWQPGEYLLDTYTLALPPQLPAGDYPLRIGFYDPVTGQRLSPVRDAQGHAQAHDQISLQVVHISE